MLKNLILLLALSGLLFVSCGKIERPEDILNDITGATRSVEAYEKNKKRIKELEEEVSTLQQKIADLGLDFSNAEKLLKQQLANAVSRIETLTQENSDLNVLRASLNATISQLSDELSQLEATNDDLEEINKAVIQKNGYLVNRVYYLQRYNRAILSAYCRLWYEVRSLRNLLIEKDNQIAELEAQVNGLNEVIEGYKANSIVLQLVDLLNSGVTELHIKFENGSKVKLKSNDGAPIISPVDEVISNTSSIL